MRSITSIVCIFCAFLYYVMHSACATKEGSYVIDLSDPDKFKFQKRPPSLDGLNLRKANLQRENVRIILSEALTNKYYRKKLIEATPMLSELSPKQLFELSKLISLQTKSKPSSDEQIGKVSQIIFGNKSAVVLKLVNDIANYARSSANIFNGLEPSGFLNIQSNRQSSQVSSTEKLNASLEDDVIGPITINKGIKEDIILSPIKKKYNERRRRSASKLLHKLIRTSPSNSTGEQIQSPKHDSSDLKLNTSSFLGPRPITEKSPESPVNGTVLSYEQIEDLAFADLNGTDTEFKGNDSVIEQLPNPEELVGNPRYRISNKYHRMHYVKGDNKRKRIPVQSHHVKLLQKQCERFTASMCIKADDYPLELIMGSIRRHKNAMSALLAEYRDKAAELEYQEQLEEYQFNTKRREDGSVITPGGMCASVVRYARPQKARSASGEWKYIVNTGRHTQTLRLEKCSTPQESCSYLSHNYRSRCTQVYNYHRLLSWDKTRGLHVDIFKVPSCCSCQVDGYRETFPPLGATKHKDYTPVPDNNPYISVNDEIDYEDEEDDDASNAYHFGGGFNKNNYQHLELLQESKKIKTKVNHPSSLNPTVGSYLSPPSDSYESKEVRPTYYTKSSIPLSGRSRKPYKNFVPNESRSDLVISGTEQSDLEVKANAISDSSRVHHKRTRLYSGAVSDENRYQLSGPIVSSESFPNYVTSTSRSTTPLHNVGSNPIANGSNSRKEVVNGKRINYNYHPIIDFFGNHQKSGKGEQHLLRNTATNSIPMSAETSTYRNRRFEVGMEGSESNWHPVVVKS